MTSCRFIVLCLFDFTIFIFHLFYCNHLEYSFISFKEPSSSGMPGVGLDELTNMDASVKMRCEFEFFAGNFASDHSLTPSIRNNCWKRFDANSSTSQILRHFEECPAICSNQIWILRDERSNALLRMGIQLPSGGTIYEIFSALSTPVHRTFMKFRFNGVIIPTELNNQLFTLAARWFIAGVMLLKPVSMARFDD